MTPLKYSRTVVTLKYIVSPQLLLIDLYIFCEYQADGLWHSNYRKAYDYDMCSMNY